MKVEEIKPYGNSEDSARLSQDDSEVEVSEQFLNPGSRKPESIMTDKGVQVERMFDSIARRYDFMNSLMSLGQHRRWRNKALKEAIRHLPNTENLNILDVATGTGDVAFRLHQLLPDSSIIGVDLSEGMLQKAKHKLGVLPVEEQKKFSFTKGDSLSLPFHNKRFNLITVAYGVRNFADLHLGLREIKRVLASDGVLCIIELSTPRNTITRWAYNIFSGKIIPHVGKRVTGDSRAYSYLPESIAACPQRDEMASLLYNEGFERVEWHSLTFGALTYYIAK